MATNKPIASVSFDLDDKWSYIKTRGNPGWESLPSYLEILVPRVLDFFKARDMIITFFVVGRDAVQEQNHELLKSIAAAGHEVGNHSFQHEPWLHLYDDSALEAEIVRTEEAIEHVIGKKPIGFRGPGFSLSKETLRQLASRGYLYDASTNPSILSPVSRAYYFLTANLDEEEKKLRKSYGGTLRDGLRSLRPYRWNLPPDNLIEIPVTTMPLFRVPIHVSYLVCLSLISSKLAMAYLRMALLLCRLRRIQPSILFHPTDFLGCGDADELAFFPGMKLPHEKKLDLMNQIFDLLSAKFSILTMEQHAQHAMKGGQLADVEPQFFFPTQSENAVSVQIPPATCEASEI